jgi:hypothetical protein
MKRDQSKMQCPVTERQLLQVLRKVPPSFGSVYGSPLILQTTRFI